MLIAWFDDIPHMLRHVTIFDQLTLKYYDVGIILDHII